MLRKPGMHGRGSQASAPASDAATREGRHRPCVRATWRFPNRADAAEIDADAAEIGVDVAQIGPTWSVSAEMAKSGRNSKKKKKKKVQNAPFDLT